MTHYQKMCEATAKLSEHEKIAMRSEHRISAVLCLMYDFQKKRPGTADCSANVAYFRIMILDERPEANVDAKAVWCVVDGKVRVHMILVVEGEVMDPTYEVHSSDAPCYYESTRQLNDDLRSSCFVVNDKAKMSFAKLSRLAYDINSGEPLEIQTSKGFKKQVMYVQNHF